MALQRADEAAVDARNLAGDVAGPRADQKRRDAGKFRRLAITAGWDGLKGFLLDAGSVSLLTLGCTMVLTVTPDPATSAASVLAKPTSAPRRLFEITRLGIGATTPDDPMIRMRPHFFSIIAGSTARMQRI